MADLMKLDRRLIATALALYLSMNACAESSLDVHRAGNEVEVAASAMLDAGPRVVWATLVDYDRLPQFIPDLLASRTLSRAGDDAVVEQSGLAGLGPFKFHIDLTLAIEEVPMTAISAHATGGDFSHFMAVYRLHALPDGRTELDYRAMIAPKGGIPPLIGVPVMRLAIRKQFEALLAEIERRGRAVQPGG
jgi:carbon monoxide dehydrogenase subunit G